MNPFQMKHRRRTSILAAALLVAATGLAVAEQEQGPASQRSSWFWSWFGSSSAPSTPAKPKPAAQARVAGQAESAKPSQGCAVFNCITLVGIGF